MNVFHLKNIFVQQFRFCQLKIREFIRSYSGCCNENVALKLNFALGEVFCNSVLC